MKRSVAVSGACVAVCLGLLLSAPAQAGGNYGYGHGKGYGHGYGHFKHQGFGRHRNFGHRHGRFRHGRRGFSDSTFLTAVGIIAGTRLIESYLYRPRYPAAPPAPAPGYAPAPPVAVPVQPRQCFQVMVPYAQPYGGIFYVPQVQCY